VPRSSGDARPQGDCQGNSVDQVPYQADRFRLRRGAEGKIDGANSSVFAAFFNTPGLKRVENDSTVIAMLQLRPITGLNNPPATAAAVLAIPPQVRAPTAPPPVQAPRVSPTIQPRRYCDRVITLGDPTFSWRGPRGTVYPFMMDSRACFEVPVVLTLSRTDV
jgi:hypothetical protein